MGKSIILIISTACNFAITWLLVPHFGALGAVIGSGFSLLVGYGVILNIYYHKVIHINMFTYYKKTYASILPVVLMCLPVGFAIYYFNPLAGWIGFFAEVMVYVLVFAVVIYLIGLNKSEKQLVRKTINKYRSYLMKK